MLFAIHEISKIMSTEFELLNVTNENLTLKFSLTPADYVFMYISNDYTDNLFRNMIYAAITKNLPLSNKLQKDQIKITNIDLKSNQITFTLNGYSHKKIVIRKLQQWWTFTLTKNDIIKF
jgi:hypothetical protein